MFEKTFSFWRHLVGKPAAPTQEVKPSTAQEDRRLWVRYATDLQGNVQLTDEQEGDKVLAKVRDLSVGGANLQVDRAIAPGQMVSLEMQTNRDEVRTVLACVVRVNTDREGKWSVGCVFSRELSSDDLGSFGAHKVPAAEEDKRTWVRFSCGLKASCRKVGDPAGIAHAAQVLNISASGIGLAVHPALQAGALLNVDLFDKGGRLVRTILACVVHTTLRTSGDYAAGCNFIRELNDEELESLI